MTSFTASSSSSPLTALVLVALAWAARTWPASSPATAAWTCVATCAVPPTDLLPSSHLDPFPTHPTALLR